VSRARGNLFVHEAALILEERGYLVTEIRDHWVRQKGRWINVGGDLFGAFDIVAVRGHGAEGEAVLFIQVTDSSHAAARRHKVEARWRWPVGLGVSASFEVWAFNPESREFSIWKLIEEGWERISGRGTGMKLTAFPVGYRKVERDPQ
jgi:hypothetical protein